mmetsp:Transcript_87319/g.151961  ORF Transcript_87319/g.151961 Transcript_87319/m.151961 type:complete len:204 (-) Transcript_87319:751-1362(-)
MAAFSRLVSCCSSSPGSTSQVDDPQSVLLEQSTCVAAVSASASSGRLPKDTFDTGGWQHGSPKNDCICIGGSPPDRSFSRACRRRPCAALRKSWIRQMLLCACACSAGCVVAVLRLDRRWYVCPSCSTVCRCTSRRSRVLRRTFPPKHWATRTRSCAGCARAWRHFHRLWRHRRQWLCTSWQARTNSPLRPPCRGLGMYGMGT